ncbi:hypothetical protein STIB_61160 [Streptomyces sp. IB2014 011-1]|nr:hypothetical protein STIB_61160 [Streptomyces sp. IB2014 011-1]
MGWLRRNRVLLPGVSVLARQVLEVRKVADRRLHATVAGAARRADPALPGDLVATMKTPEGSRLSELERLARLSPLEHANLNLLGRYSFTASVPATGALRPLRDPDAVELDEDEDDDGAVKE